MKIDKIDATVSKINRLTKEDKLIWETSSRAPSSLNGSENLIDFVYSTKVSDSSFRLYKYQFRLYTDIDEYVLSQSHRLELIDEYGNSLWDFPRDTNIKDLYDTVRFKTSKAEDFFNKFLSE